MNNDDLKTQLLSIQTRIKQHKKQMQLVRKNLEQLKKELTLYIQLKSMQHTQDFIINWANQHNQSKQTLPECSADYKEGA